MSATKKSVAKASQNYRDKPVWPECRNCAHFASDIPKTGFPLETNMRCTIGGFKVKKLGTCDKHKLPS